LKNDESFNGETPSGYKLNLDTKCLKDQSQISTTEDSTNKDQFFYGSNFSRSLFRVSDFNRPGVARGEVGGTKIGVRDITLF